jgi:hypothetical protein
LHWAASHRSASREISPARQSCSLHSIKPARVSRSLSSKQSTLTTFCYTGSHCKALEGPFSTFVLADAKGRIGTEPRLLPPFTCKGETSLPLCCTMDKRVRITPGVLSLNFLKIQLQGLPSFYASKRSSSRASHVTFILVLK